MIPGLRVIDDILKGLPENARLREQLVELRSQVEILQAENQKLKADLDKIRWKDDLPEYLDTPALFTLSALSSNPSGVTAKEIARCMQMRVNDVKCHIDEFLEWKIVELSRGDMGDGCEYRLNSAGRAYYRRLDEKEQKP